MALDETQLSALEDPNFRVGIVRRALVMTASSDTSLDREVAILGQAFLHEIDVLFPFEDMSSDEEAAIRDAVRTHLGKVRIAGEKIPRRKGIRLLLPAKDFEREEAKAVQEFADLLQVDLFVEMLKNRLLISRLFKELEETKLTAEASKLIAENRAYDQLTKLPTRNYGAEKVRLKVEEDPKKPLGILLIDVDHFKRVNDTMGHPYADRVLAAVAKIIREQIHMDDIALRYGGEEILIVLDVDNREQALKVAQRLRMAIQTKTSVTVSIGVEFAPGSEILNIGDPLAPVDQAELFVDSGVDFIDGDCTTAPIDSDSGSLITESPVISDSPSDVISEDSDVIESLCQTTVAELESVGDTSLVDGLVVEVLEDAQSLEFDINGPATTRADGALYKAKGLKTEATGRNRVQAAWKDEPEPREWIEPEEDTSNF